MTRAWLAIALCACGDGIAAPDATMPDADPERGIVEVHVLAVDIFRPTSVYFQERDSSLALATHLDENGRARGYLHPHGFVTVIPEIVGGVTPFYTYANVSPGDTLVIDPNQTTKGGAQIRIRIPPLLGTQFYTLETPCGITDISQAAMASIIVDMSGCGASADLIVVAHAPAGDVYIYENDVMLSEGTMVMVSLADRQYRTFETSTVNVVGVPDQAQRWYVEKGIALGPNVVHSGGTVQDVVDRSISLSTLGPLLPEATALTNTYSADGNAAGSEALLDWRPATAEITIDLAQYDLRDQTSPARYVPEANTIVWTESTIGIAPVITTARMQWATPDTLLQWTILSRRDDEARIVLPVLPHPELAPDPHAPPYDMFRVAVMGGATTVLDRLLGWTPAARWPVEGDSGTVVWQTLTQ